MAGENEIVLSVIVKIVGGQTFLRRCLDRLVSQIADRPIEVIVPYDATVSDIGECLRDYPGVAFLDMGVVRTHAPHNSRAVAHEMYDRRAAAGLVAAQGEVLAMLEDTAVPASDWCDQVLEAHRLPYGVVGGAVEHAGRGALNWAVYFQDFGRYQLPLREGPTASLTDVNVSYKRQALVSGFRGSHRSELFHGPWPHSHTVCILDRCRGDGGPTLEESRWGDLRRVVLSIFPHRPFGSA